jgi:hypothetical protein
MTSRLSAEMPLPTDAARGEASSVTRLPDFLHEPFAAAMSQSTLLPAFIALFGVVAALFLLGFGNQPARRSGQPEPAPPCDGSDESTEAVHVGPGAAGYVTEDHRQYSREYAE